MIDSTLISLLDQKIELLKNINDVGIIWWTSTIVFSVTIIGIIWKEKDEVVKFTYLNKLFFAINTFFVAVILFGCWMIFIVRMTALEYQELATYLTAPTDTFAFWGSMVGFGMGVFTFIVIFSLWLKLFKYIRENKS